MDQVQQVPSPRRATEQLEPVIGAERYARLRSAAADFRTAFGDRIIWNVNSTAAGGGVAEMLQVLVGYVEDLGVAIRWLVIRGDADFFAVTKRLHNGIHGYGEPVPIGAAEADHYQRVLLANAAEMRRLVRPGDIVLLHDPQTAGLAGPLADAGALVVWRCHIGADTATAVTETAWQFLRPHVTAAHAWVFSRRSYIPAWLTGPHVWIIPPSIDPFSAKNQAMDTDTVHAILARIGLIDGSAGDPGRFVRRDGTRGEVTRRASVAADGLPAAGDDLLVQVSRWDRLKDMAGVMHGFARHVASRQDCHLALVGPTVTDVADDPEGAVVYQECLAQWRALPAPARSRVMLVTLPLDDVEENAAMVNAVQRHASIVTQKSLAEGFGLTVAEAMWKGRPVVGSAVGGINDQIAPGTGVLLREPADLRGFGVAVRELLDDPPRRNHLGEAAHAYVRRNFVGDIHLLRYAGLFSALRKRG
jgi:trehalose synthase